jgi:hypothetical protein
MPKRRTIKAALTAATIAAAVALPVSAASAASTTSAATASPQVRTVVDEGMFSTYEDCTYEGSTLMLQDGSTGYRCNPMYECQPGWCVVDGWDLLSYFDL